MTSNYFVGHGKLPSSIYRSIFDHSTIGIAILGLDGGWLKVNTSFCSNLGYSEEELLSKTFKDITHRDDIENDLEHLKRLIDDQIPYYRIEKRYIHRDGYIVWALVCVSIVRDSRGYPLYLINQMEDITERKLFEESMQAALITDELTGMYNRRGFLERGLEQMSVASRQARVCTLFLVALEDMKQLNQTLGQKQGDVIIREFSHVLQEAFGRKGTVGRTGGVEFAVLITDATETEAAQIGDCIAGFGRGYGAPRTVRFNVHATRCLPDGRLLSEQLLHLITRDTHDSSG